MIHMNIATVCHRAISTAPTIGICNICWILPPTGRCPSCVVRLWDTCSSMSSSCATVVRCPVRQSVPWPSHIAARRHVTVNRAIHHIIGKIVYCWAVVTLSGVCRVVGDCKSDMACLTPVWTTPRVPSNCRTSVSHYGTFICRSWWTRSFGSKSTTCVTCDRWTRTVFASILTGSTVKFLFKAVSVRETVCIPSIIRNLRYTAGTTWRIVYFVPNSTREILVVLMNIRTLNKLICLSTNIKVDSIQPSSVLMTILKIVILYESMELLSLLLTFFKKIGFVRKSGP